MSSHKEIAKKAKVHVRYMTSAGKRVPGVTTIIKNLTDSGGLVHAAWKLGIEGINYRTHWDEKARTGTLLHDMAAGYFIGEEASSDEYTQREIDLANNSYMKFLAWIKQHDVDPLFIEKQIISDPMMFGGTIDFLGLVDGERTLLDFKSGKIYPDTWFQIAGYDILADEVLGYKAEKYTLLRVPTDNTEIFEDPTRTDISLERQIFINALDIHHFKLSIKRRDR